MQDELKNLVFHHFEEREYWPLKELNFHCRQPEVYRFWLDGHYCTLVSILMHSALPVFLLQSFLKEVLKEICIYHRKGPNKSCYELKPQYKDGVSSNA